MRNYYAELELQPGATLEEIKFSYRQLSKEYHPDKLPPGTPEKARQHIEEKFKSINEAYSILIDLKERGLDSEPLRDVSPEPVNNKRTDSSNFSSSFDHAKIQKAAKAIEDKRSQIELSCKQTIAFVCSSLERNLKLLGIRDEDLNNDNLMDRWKYISCFTLFFFLSYVFFSAAWNYYSFVLLILAFLSAFFCVRECCLIFSPCYSKDVIEKANKARDQFQAHIKSAEKRKESELSSLEYGIRQRIDYFKTINAESLSSDFVKKLSGEDQLFLLCAIKEKNDVQELTDNMKTAAKVAVGLGIVAALFGLGF